MATAAVQSDPPLIVRGQLAIRTIPGRNGRFTVGRLTTRLGLFHVKDPELEQYPEGKYDGEFVIRYIYPKAYPVGDGMRFEIRANLDGMTLSGIDKLSKAEARAFAAQDVDPLDEELGTPPATTPATAEKSKSRSKPEPAPVQASKDPLVDTTPFGASASTMTDTPIPEDTDATLFGTLWPLGESIKLDATVDRRVLRQQRDRLGVLGYEFAPLTQDWHRVSA